jgi:hypothetical protein
VSSGYDIAQVNLFVEEVRQRFAMAKEHLHAFHRDNERLRKENEQLTKMVHNVAEAGEEMIAASRREAEKIIAEATTEAAERVTVARADAKSLVAQERLKVIDELEMLAVVRQTVVRERDTLMRFHSDLNGRLRGVVEAIINYNDESGVEELSAIGQLIPSALMPAPVAPPALIDEDDGVDAPIVVAHIVEPDDAPASEPEFYTAVHQYANDAEPLQLFSRDEAEEAAFDAFFSGNVEAEPSREWMLNES